LVFDFDGTLVDTRGAYCQAMAEAFNQKDIDLAPEEIAEFLFPSIRGTIADILRAMERFNRQLVLDLEKDTIDSLSALWFGNVQPIKGMPELLNELRDTGSQLYLVSNSHSSFVLAALTDFQLGECFNNIVTLDSGHRDKSESLEYIAHNASCLVAELVYVADTIMDAHISNELGLPLIILLTKCSWDYDRKDEFPEAIAGMKRVDIAPSVKDAKMLLMKYIEEAAGDFC